MRGIPNLRTRCGEVARAQGRPGLPWAFLIAALAIGATPAAAAEGGTVRFLAPLHLAPAVDRSQAVLNVVPPDGAQVVRVVVELDGKPLDVLTQPPWRLVWDAGDGETKHTLRAKAEFSDGSTATAEVTTSPLVSQDYADVSLVSFYATVRDSGGRYVTGLAAEDFKLTENGRPQKIERFSNEPKPLRVAIVLDCSNSMNEERGNRIAIAKAAAQRFLEAMAPGDQALVVRFNDDVQVVQPMTGDTKVLGKAIEGLQPRGGTALYDAVWGATEKLSHEDGRKVVLLLSDGRDEAYSGTEPGSLHTFDEALLSALRHEVMVFPIGIGEKELDQLDFHGRRIVRDMLNDLATATGGLALFPTRPKQVLDAFMDVAVALRNQYSVAYTSDDTRKDGSWRETVLTSTRPKLTVVSRRGYYARKESGS